MHAVGAAPQSQAAGLSNATNTTPRAPKKKSKKLVDINGDVSKDLGNGMFQLKLENGVTVMAHLSGKIRQNRIKIVMGDKVTVELSPYDLTKVSLRACMHACMSDMSDMANDLSAPVMSTRLTGPQFRRRPTRQGPVLHASNPDPRPAPGENHLPLQAWRV